MEAQTGKDPSGNVIAALFGPDSPAQAATQLASADAAAPTLSGSSQTVTAAAPTTALASLVAPAPSAIAALSPLAAPAPASPPDASPAEASPVQASPPDALPPAPAPAKAMLASLGPKPAPITTDQAAVINRLAAGDPATIAKLAAANPKKLPFGGVMDPSTLQGSNMALALASSAPGLQMGNTVYTGRALNGLKPGFATAGYNGAVLPASATTGVAGGATMIQAQASQTTNPTSSLVAASSGTDPNASSFATGTHNPLPAALISDIETLRAINQYQNAARMSVPGAKAINLN